MLCVMLLLALSIKAPEHARVHRSRVVHDTSVNIPNGRSLSSWAYPWKHVRAQENLWRGHPDSLCVIV